MFPGRLVSLTPNPLHDRTDAHTGKPDTDYPS